MAMTDWLLKPLATQLEPLRLHRLGRAVAEVEQGTYSLVGQLHQGLIVNGGNFLFCPVVPRGRGGNGLFEDFAGIGLAPGLYGARSHGRGGRRRRGRVGNVVVVNDGGHGPTNEGPSVLSGREELGRRGREDAAGRGEGASRVRDEAGGGGRHDDEV